MAVTPKTRLYKKRLSPRIQVRGKLVGHRIAKNLHPSSRENVPLVHRHPGELPCEDCANPTNVSLAKVKVTTKQLHKLTDVTIGTFCSTTRNSMRGRPCTDNALLCEGCAGPPDDGCCVYESSPTAMSRRKASRNKTHRANPPPASCSTSHMGCTKTSLPSYLHLGLGVEELEEGAT